MWVINHARPVGIKSPRNHSKKGGATAIFVDIC
jgi:hypothetical protein